MADEGMTSEELKKRLDAWEANRQRLDGLGMQLEITQRDLREAEEALGAFITPEGAKPGQVFHIWIRKDAKREALLEVSVYEVSSSRGMIVAYRVGWWKP